MKTCMRWFYILIVGLVVLTGALCIMQGWRDGRLDRLKQSTQWAYLPYTEGEFHARA